MVLIYILNMVNFDLKYGIVRYYLYVTCYIQNMDLEVTKNFEGTQCQYNTYAILASGKVGIG